MGQSTSIVVFGKSLLTQRSRLAVYQQLRCRSTEEILQDAEGARRLVGDDEEFGDDGGGQSGGGGGGGGGDKLYARAAAVFAESRLHSPTPACVQSRATENVGAWA
eukprot:5580964-Pleurochrysis_carterae.AAC.1